MKDTGLWADATLVAYAGCFIAGAVFLVAFLQTAWRSHPWGRNVVAVMAMLEVQEGLIFARRLFWDWPGRQVIVALVAWLFFATVTWRAVIQIRGMVAQRKARRRDARKRAIRELSRPSRRQHPPEEVSS